MANHMDSKAWRVPAAHVRAALGLDLWFVLALQYHVGHSDP